MIYEHRLTVAFIVKFPCPLFCHHVSVPLQYSDIPPRRYSTYYIDRGRKLAGPWSSEAQLEACLAATSRRLHAYVESSVVLPAYNHHQTTMCTLATP